MTKWLFRFLRRIVADRVTVYRPWDYEDVYDGPWYVSREPRDDQRLAVKSGVFTILTVGDYFDGGGPIEERLRWICDRVNAQLAKRTGDPRHLPEPTGTYVGVVR